jgi:hypothetical protein
VYAIVLLIVIAILSLLITRIATIALSVTGMAHQAARFQARSALSGVGYTTREAETVVNHPVRRRIVMALMLAGNVGLVTAVAGLLAGFLGAGGRQAAIRTMLLVGGLAAVYTVSRVGVRGPLAVPVTGRGDRPGLRPRHPRLRWSAAPLPRLHPQELTVDADHWMAGRSLRECALRDEGATVLGMARADGGYLGAPDGDTEVEAGDTLVVYGHREVFADLAGRRPGAAGDDGHHAAVGRHRRRKAHERRHDPARA